jgi:hypothetical protein
MNIVAADGEEPNGSVGGVIGQLSFDKVATLVTEEKEEGQLISSSSWDYRAGVLTVSNCANEGVIQADLAENVGGVIGNLFSFYDFEGNSIQLQDCANRGTVQGGTHSGGVVGYCDPAYGALVISGCRNEGQVTSTSGYAGGIVGYTSPGMYEFTVTGCENVGGVNGAVTSGGILGCYFGFSTKSLKENQTALTITKCVNSGVVSSDSGISGTGGIVGGIQTVQIANAVVVEQCQNTGTVQSLSGGRVGGILGSSALIINANPGPFYTVRNCVNSGSLVMGDGEQNFADTQPKSGDPDSESASVENDTILVLGAMSVGGIVGYHQQGVIENCVNTGTILLDSKMAVRDVAAAASGSDDDDVTSVFAGAIAGFFLYMDDETYQAARITDCQYDNSAPQALSQMSDSEAYAAAVTGVTAVPAAQAQAAAASALN